MRLKVRRSRIDPKTNVIRPEKARPRTSKARRAPTKATTTNGYDMTEQREAIVPCLIEIDQMGSTFPDLEINYPAEIRDNLMNGRNKKLKFKLARPNRSLRSAIKEAPKSTRTTNKIMADSKPGTAGSRQALRAPSSGRAPRRKSLSSKAEQLDQALFATTVIDTNDMVDETLICSLTELCQRAQIETPPSNPLELCRSFTISLPNLDLPNPV